MKTNRISHSPTRPTCIATRRARRRRAFVTLAVIAGAVVLAVLAVIGTNDADAHRIRPGACNVAVAAAEPGSEAIVAARCRAFVAEHRLRHSARPMLSSCYADGTDGFLGRRTASGKVVTLTSRFVAHRTLPFGTRLVIYGNGRRVVATVQDRGPYSGARELDLAFGAARVLGFRSCAAYGVRTVRVARLR